ncbi:Na+/melibiose symporter [Pseudovibrio ascidiaceicola]|uniref:Na+/melibiose symporter n=1 Tax=Pseudovibrio ascidiaceicola TaxID=285279 RepID=A0A1I4FZA9_9HYPH|nr:MFS transporter [Pseudovibrio ascidiaceicola]SFL22829.1 Na+/melibiose symporter [Pseudovibrio ascidiaceicola]
MKLLILFFANFIASIAMGISLTIVPWELAQTSGGAKFLAFTATWSTAVLIFVSPIAGRLVDSISRRYSLILCVVIMAVVLQLAAIAYGSQVFKVISLSAFYFCSQIFFLFFYNALSAFIQEIFDDTERGKVNGWMQAEMQAATFVVGLLMIYLVNERDFQLALMINGGLLVIAAILLRLIPYTQEKRPARAKISKDVYRVIFSRLDLILLGIGGNITFVCVMMLNIIHPVYFNNVLNLEIAALAQLSISFGIGAGLGGFFIGRFVSDTSALPIIKICLLVYSGSLLTICLNPQLVTILVLYGVMGATGSAIRVAYNTYVMSVIDTSIFGSYLGVISTLTYIQRTIFGLILGLIISAFPNSNYYWFAFAIISFGALCILIASVTTSEQKLEMEY